MRPDGGPPLAKMEIYSSAASHRYRSCIPFTSPAHLTHIPAHIPREIQIRSSRAPPSGHPPFSMEGPVYRKLPRQIPSTNVGKRKTESLLGRVVATTDGRWSMPAIMRSDGGPPLAAAVPVRKQQHESQWILGTCGCCSLVSSRGQARLQVSSRGNVSQDGRSRSRGSAES